jgi:hypothetical protein
MWQTILVPVPPTNPTLTLLNPNPPQSPRCALWAMPWHLGCDSEPSPPLSHAQIAQRDLELDFDPVSQNTDRSR